MRLVVQTRKRVSCVRGQAESWHAVVILCISKLAVSLPVVPHVMTLSSTTLFTSDCAGAPEPMDDDPTGLKSEGMCRTTMRTWIVARMVW